MAFDPFKIDGPTCLSFSGGRTSAYMLWRILQSNGGLPADALPIFANTGKEEEATLRFVRDVAQRWGVNITWLEYVKGGIFTTTSFDYASRNGEPYEAIIAQRDGALPNPRSRYCSSELKTRTMHRYLRSIGWTEWESMVGIRADEPSRVAKLRFNPHPETKSEYVRIPLADAFVSSKEVGHFWKQQPFDLGLPNVNGKTMHGNCDLCFLKPAAQVMSLVSEKRSRAVWWAKQEQAAKVRTTGDGAYFRNDRPTYQQMHEFTRDQATMFEHAASQVDDGIECIGCTD
jgi:3'-phosphoadenosine 5'-phosphosulfate sulfotransferase (PAPS reductase)/FAD synthetase